MIDGVNQAPVFVAGRSIQTDCLCLQGKGVKDWGDGIVYEGEFVSISSTNTPVAATFGC